MPQLTIQQAFELAVRHHQAGQLPQAEQIYRQILAQQPGHADALHMLGLIAHQVGQNDSAVDLIRQALALRPNFPGAYNNLGLALKAQGQLDAAIAAYRQALVLKPHYPGAYNNLGDALKERGQFDAAIAACRQAIAQNPHYAEAHYNLGNALKDHGQLEAAIAAYRQALALKPDYPEACCNLGTALKGTGQFDAAIAAFHQAIALRPHFAEAYGNLGATLCDKGQPDEAIATYRQALALSPDSAWIRSNLIFILHYHPAYGTQAIAEELRHWNSQIAASRARLLQPQDNERSAERRLRIGYVSPDLRDHVVGRNMMPLFKHLDREHFETFCYANLMAPDHLTEEFRRRSGTFRMVLGLSDQALAEQIRADGIDILVDLALHTPGNRLPVFARKPAPVQVTFAGYPGSTGLSAMDYRLTDPYLDPPEPGVDELYVEKPLRLPATFWCYDPLMEAPPAAGPLPALSNGYVTFGCLNNICKINGGVLKLWVQVLADVANSRLVLLVDEEAHRQRMLKALDDLGVPPPRVCFAGRRSRFEYLKLYQQIDIGLDTVPYNGHTTSLDSYFMGVPVVTLVGRTVVGRAGLSQLTNLGLPELIARTPEEYIHIARDLACDLGRLAGLRAGLRTRMQASPLMDGAAFARGIEAAYRQMWRQWCTQPPILR